jgi:multiple sugar transport system permease protein
VTKAGMLREIRKNWQNYALMAPFLILFALFTLIPIIYSVVISFTNFNIFTTPTFVGWDNYLRMFFDDDVFIIAIRNTLIFALITGPVSYALCFVFAWLINELRPKVRAVVTLIFYAPVLSGTAFTVWSFIFSSDQYGLLNGYLMELGILREPMGWLTDPAYILFVVIFVQLWMSLGTGFLSFIAGLQGVDRTLYEAGLVDGVHNRFQELWYITLPVMKPQLLFGAVMQIVSSFSVADVSVRLAGFPSTQYAAETLVTHIMDYGTVRFEMGYACALACFLFALMYLANKLVTFALGRVGT